MIYELYHYGKNDYYFKGYSVSAFPSHLHYSFEFVFVLSGTLKVTVDSHEYFLQKDEGMLIFPHQIHSLDSIQPHYLYCIFSPDLVKSYHSVYQYNIPASNKFKPSESATTALENLLPDSDILEKKACLYMLCSEFHKNAEYKERKNKETVLTQIFVFIEENLSGDCSLTNLARQTGYTYSYLSREFKKNTGISFNKYVNIHRINAACHMLRSITKPIIECAFECGYKSLRSFNMNFKAVTGITPSEYIRNHKK